jgi:homocitrate synthase
MSDDAVKSVTAQIKALADQKRLTLDDVDYLLRSYHSAVVDADAIEAMESLEAVAAD